METAGTGKSRVAFGLFFFLLLSISISLVLSASLDETEKKAELDVKAESGVEKLKIRICIKIKIRVNIYRRADFNSMVVGNYLKGDIALATEEVQNGRQKWYQTRRGWIPVSDDNVEKVRIQVCLNIGLGD